MSNDASTYESIAERLRSMRDTDALTASQWVAEGLAWNKLNESFGRKDDYWKTAPSAEAMALLDWVLASPANRCVFWQTIWPKRIPSRSQVDQIAAMRDDGLASLELIDKYRRGMEEMSSRAS